MQSEKVDAFYSCSFKDEDTQVNDFFLAICGALDVNCENVSTGYAQIAPEVAKQKIKQAQAVIVVCVCRDAMSSGGFMMPQSCNDEIGIAFGTDTPLLMFIETGVTAAGFKPNYGTWLSFDRTDLFNPDFMKKAIEAIHRFKVGLLPELAHGITVSSTDRYAEKIEHLIELREQDGDYEWAYTTHKRYVFTASTKRPLTIAAWAMVPSHKLEAAKTMEWSHKSGISSRGIKLIPELTRQDAVAIEGVLRFDPTPNEGDTVEYEEFVSSRYLNPVWAEDVEGKSRIRLESGTFQCADGLVIIYKTKQAVLEFRFPKSYGLRKFDVQPFVGVYTSGLDYEVKSELERLSLDVREVAGSLTVRMVVESALPGHLYGIAWNPRVRKGMDAEVGEAS